MTLPKQLTTITSLSKVLAAVLFLTLPFLGFYLGRGYEKVVTPDFTEVPLPIVRTTPKPITNPTTNWKTYTNNKYRYSFKYKPNDKLKTVSCAQYKDGAKNGDERLIFYDSSIPASDQNLLYQCLTQGEAHIITLTISENTDSCQSTNSWKATKSIITVGGITASRCESVFIGQKAFPGPDETTTVSIPSNNNQYIIITQYNKEFSETFNQILSTFKFLDQE